MDGRERLLNVQTSRAKGGKLCCFSLSIMQIRGVVVVVISTRLLLQARAMCENEKKALAIIFNVFPPNSELVEKLNPPITIFRTWKQLYQANQLNTTFLGDLDEFIYFLLQLKNGSQVGAIVQVIRKDYIVVTLPLLKYRLCYAPAKLVSAHAWRQPSLSWFCTQVT